MGGGSPLGGSLTVAQAVDEGLPLVRHLANSFGVKPATIRALRGLSGSADTVIRRPPLGWQHLLRVMYAIAPERYPRTLEHWRDFSTLCGEGVHIHEALMHLHATVARRFTPNVLEPWLARVGRDWNVALAKWRDGFRGAHSLEGSSLLAQDVGAYFRVTRISSSHRYRIAARMGAWTPAQWQGACNRYAALDQKSPARGEKDAPSWHDVFGSGTGLALPVLALNTDGRLFAEGQTMQHCIYTYRQSLMMRRRLAFAVGADGTPDRSTVYLEYEPAPDGNWAVRILQQHGFRNARPSETSVEVAARLREFLASPGTRDALDRAELARVHRVESLRKAGENDSSRLSQDDFEAAGRVMPILREMGILGDA